MVVYGKPDEDTATVDALQNWLREQPAEATYILHHQRVPIDARPCRLPQSLTTQLVLEDKRVVTAFQAKPGAKVAITIT